MPATNTTRYTVTERFDADQAAVWTARAGRRVAATVVAPKEHGMWDTDLLRKALAEHAGVSAENVRPRRTPSDRQIAPRVWEVVLPEEAPAEDAPAAEAPKTCPGCSAPEGEPCRDALLDLIAEDPTPAAVEDVEEVDYRMFVGILFEDAKDMGIHKAANVREAIKNNAEQGHRAVRTEDGMIHVYYSWFVPQRAAVEEDAAEEADETPARYVVPVGKDTRDWMRFAHRVRALSCAREYGLPGTAVIDTQAEAVILDREPWRGGQHCGHEITVGRMSSQYCGARKASGLALCLPHHDEVTEEYGTVRMAPGNALGDPSAPLTLMWEGEDGKPVAPTAEERPAAEVAEAPEGHGYTWGDAREVKASALAVGDVFVKPGMGSAYFVSQDGRVRGAGIAWEMPMDGTAWTVVDRDGDTTTCRSHTGETKTADIPEGARVLRVAEVAEAPEEEITPTARTVYLVALAEPVQGYTMAGTTVRTEYVREAIRTAARVEVKAARIGTEGIIRVGSLLYIPQALTTA
jgi:hypothetical protein